MALIHHSLVCKYFSTVTNAAWKNFQWVADLVVKLYPSCTPSFPSSTCEVIVVYWQLGNCTMSISESTRTNHCWGFVSAYQQLQFRLITVRPLKCESVIKSFSAEGRGSWWHLSHQPVLQQPQAKAGCIFYLFLSLYCMRMVKWWRHNWSEL